MVILHTVERFIPEINGMTEVVKQLSYLMSKAGHQVIICTSFCESRDFKYWNGIKIESFDISGNFVNGYIGKDIDKYKNYLLTTNYDIITNFAAQQWATDLVFDVLPLIKAKKYFVPTGFSALYISSYDLYFKNMINWMKLYDNNIFLSNKYRDINFAKKHGINNHVVIPNGASDDEFENNFNDIKKKYNIPKHSKIILHVGNYTQYKGHIETLEIFNKCSYKDAVLVFIGKNFNKSESMWFTSNLSWFKYLFHIKFYKLRAVINFKQYFTLLIKNKLNKIYLIDCDRSETVSFFKAADIFLFPSNIECSPIVLFESCAGKTMFLSSDVGNTPEIAEWTSGGVILPTKFVNNLSFVDVSKSSQILTYYLNNDNERDKISTYGYKNWKKYFTWEYITSQYLDIYSK